MDYLVKANIIDMLISALTSSNHRVSGQSPPTVRTDWPVYSAGSCATTPHLQVVRLFYIIYIVYSCLIEAIQTV